jgi:HEAT repeat protein
VTWFSHSLLTVWQESQILRYTGQLQRQAQPDLFLSQAPSKLGKMPLPLHWLPQLNEAQITKWRDWQTQIYSLCHLQLGEGMLDPAQVLIQQLATEDSVHLPQQLTALARLLANPNVSMIEQGNYYRQLIKQLQQSALPLDVIPGLLLNYLIDLEQGLQQHLADSDIAKCLALLRQEPLLNGWRASWHIAQGEFYTTLKAWVSSTPTHATSPVVWMQDLDDFTRPLSRQYYLTPEIERAFFDNSYLRHKPVGQRGRHVVLPIPIIETTHWAKIAPENPAMESLVNALDRRLNGGQGSLLSATLKLMISNQPIAVQIFDNVAGLNLEDALQEKPELLNQLDLASFTRTLLRVLLINPEDDKGDDYYLILQGDCYQLKRIDNERAFYTVNEKGFFSSTLQVKSQLYSLNQMQQALDSEVLAEFNRLEPIQLLKSWLQEAQQLHHYYSGLFQDSDRKRHFEFPVPFTSILAVGIAEGLEKELLKRLDAMQGMIRLAKADNLPLTGMRLLSTVQPDLANYYERAFYLYPVDLKQPGLAVQRFTSVTKSLYVASDQGYKQSNVHGLAAASKTLRLKVQLTLQVVQAIARGEQLSPTQALKRLQSLTTQRVDEVKEALCQNKAEVQQHFQQLAFRQQCAIVVTLSDALQQDSTAYPLETQRHILQTIAGVPFNELTLNVYKEVLTDDLLLPLLQGAQQHLWKLDISGCWRLTQTSIVFFADNCPNIEKLILRALNPPSNEQQPGLTALRPLSKFGVLTYFRMNDPIIFLALRELDMQGCSHLTQLVIQAPQLERLTLAYCSTLGQVRTGSEQLRQVDIRDCKALREATMLTLTSAWVQVVDLQIQGCIQLKHLSFREMYPWLADLGWNNFAPVSIANLEQGLQQVSSGHPLTIRIKQRIRERLLHWEQQMTSIVTQLLLGAGGGVGFEVAETALQELVLAAAVQADRVLPILLNRVLEKKISNVGRVALWQHGLELAVHADQIFLEGRIYVLRMLGLVVAMHADQVLPVLLEVAKDEVSKVREAAILALGKTAAMYANQVLPALFIALKDKDSDICKAAFKAAFEVLGQVDSTYADQMLPVLLETAKDQDLSIRGVTMLMLGEVVATHADQVLPILLAAASKGNDLKVRGTALWALGRAVAMHADQALPVLLAAAAKDNNLEVREAALDALGMAAVHSDQVLPVLLEAAKDQASFMSTVAILILREQAIMQEEDQVESVLLLLETAKDQDWLISGIAELTVIRAVAMYVDQVLPVLLETVKDNALKVRELAILLLGQGALRTHTDQVLPVLLAAAKDNSLEVCQAAMLVALRQAVAIHADQVLPVLLETAKGQNVLIRGMTILTLGQAVAMRIDQVLREISTRMGRRVVDVVLPELRKVRAAAVLVLGQVVVTHADQVLPVLLAAVKDNNLEVRKAALGALGQSVIMHASQVLPVLLEVAKDNVSKIRNETILTLGEAVAMHADQVLSILLAAASKGNDLEVRKAVLEALGKAVAMHVDQALPVLLTQLKTPTTMGFFHIRKYERDAIVCKQKEALWALGQVVAMHVDQVLPVLLAATKDDDTGEIALQVLGQAVAACADQVLPALLLEAADEDSDSKVCEAAIKALELAVATHVDQVLPTLLNVAVKGKEGRWRVDKVREAAMQVLGQVVALYADLVLPVLLEAAKDEASEVRKAAIKVLEPTAAVHTDRVLPVLLEAAKDEASEVRKAAISVLGPTVAVHADRVLPVLLEAAKDKIPEVRSAAIKVLGPTAAVHMDQVLPVLLEAEKDEVTEVREAAMRALGCALTFSVDNIVAVMQPLLTQDNSTSAASLASNQESANHTLPQNKVSFTYSSHSIFASPNRSILPMAAPPRNVHEITPTNSH